MTAPSAGASYPSEPGGVSRRVVVGVVVAVLALVFAAVVTMVLVAVIEVTRPIPQFDSLAQNPDPSIHGTVAYFADRNGCVRVVAASGQPSKDVLCLPGQDVSKAEKLGKELGPQLVWLPDGRLQVTMFRMTDPPGPGFNPGWQKIVDVRTGAVQDVPQADVPRSPDLATHSLTSPSGQTVTTVSDGGHVVVALASASGSRTLLDVQGPGEYTYGLISAFWAPDYKWIAADDGRILVITTGESSVTRVLTDESGQASFGGDDSQLARFAVTALDLLPSAK
ncbi:MAG: hypothetical protein WCP28_00720 [Actinomycetes bacterium]